MAFDRVKEDYEKIQRTEEDVYGDQHFVTVLCGNKTDLEIQRVITTTEGRELAKQWNATFIETSAKTGKNVHELFEMLIREIRAFKGQRDRGIKVS